MDNRLLTIGRPSGRELRQHGLSWYAQGDNHDYIAPEVVRVTTVEANRFREDADQVYRIFTQAARYVAENRLWTAAGIPPAAVALVEYSLREELGQHLIGRFDYAGGLGGHPLKVLEFNADTFSLLPESMHIQRMQLGMLPRRERKRSGQFNLLMPGLIEGFQQLLEAHPHLTPSLLITGLGHEEDWLNLEVIEAAAERAGFEDIRMMALDKVIFSPDDGIFIEPREGEFHRFDFMFKMAPWEFIAYEEPALLEILTTIVCNKLAVVSNPAYCMLLQSKGLLPFLEMVAPGHPSLLKASLKVDDLPVHRYAAKPMFGRTGDNVCIYDGRAQPIARNDGDFGDFPTVYQELARFDQDGEGCVYQPSVFWADGARSLCLRRQDDLIVDDDAEFVGHVIQDDDG
ncbi:MAG: glutathionylspermidine synthase family protein [Lewinella sp.]|nr:glutathionylspermidine synthase family protein [Lewinella sp.]